MLAIPESPAVTSAQSPEDQATYDVIARALRYIEETREDRPALEDVAAAAGLSPAHFQRVFSRWVGVSPKRYLDYLTLVHARDLLDQRFTVLDAAYEAGLSSASRLHDLFVRWEAMSPGDYARRGKGLDIRVGWFDGPFGRTLAMATDRGLCGLAFAAEDGEARTMADMRGRWPAARFVDDADAIRPWVEAAFARRGEVRLHLSGAPFQLQVWEALLQVPEGAVTTYSEIARHIGNPKAVRAVGTAVGRNPISFLIPCHRALRRDGEMGGYHWGLPLKRAMLAWEAARSDATAA